MESWEKFFSVGIRLVFVFAFAAFLQASMSHVATFFHNFEPQDTGWVGPYMLAISVDGTALMLTIGMMFFSANMPGVAKVIVWFFIINLTAFSWLVNWEYAVTFQSAAITGHLAPMWKDINPVLASSFAFLNLAYSVVAEFFTLRRKSVDELKLELAELTGEKSTLERQIKEAKGPGVITTIAGKAKEVKAAVKEVVTDTSEAASQELTQEVQIEDRRASPFVDNEVAFPPNGDEGELSTDTPFIDDITAYLARQEKDPGPVSALSTNRDTEPQAKVTRKLSPQLSAKTSTPKSRETARQKALRFLKKYPDIGPSELAKKAQITRQYASKIIAETA